MSVLISHEMSGPREKVPVPERRCRDFRTMSQPARSKSARISAGLRLPFGCVSGTILGCLLSCTLGSRASTPDKTSRTHAVATAHPSKMAASHGADPHGPELSVASLGGGLQDAQQNTLFGPFSKQSGVRVQLQAWDGKLATLQSRAQTRTDKNNADWDLVLMEEAPLQVACREGLLLSRPLTIDPASTTLDSPGRACGVSAWRMNLVLAWDKSRVDTVPTWTDFWDVARRPGKRGLRRDPRGTLEIALMADGVAPDDVYRTLATADGMDRAFRKLDQLKPYIVWWNTPAEAVQIIESGAVLMTSAPDGEVATADQAGHRSFGTQAAQSLGMNVSWAVPRATSPEHWILAKQLLSFLADPIRQSTFLASYPILLATRSGGSEKPSRDATEPATPPPGDAGHAPGGDNHQHATLMMDDGFWVDHLVSLQRRFDGWIGMK